MQVRIVEWSALTNDERSALLLRSESDITDAVAVAETIVADVARRGDTAVRELSARLDRMTDPDLPLRVGDDEIAAAVDRIDPNVRASIDYAIANVRAVHETQREHQTTLTEVRPGILAGERTVAIDSVGLYVPRGRGSFPSMLYMLAVPAQIAGVRRLVVTTPSAPDGSVDAACLYAADRCGVHDVYRVGGAQAIAALAYGTESIPAVDKIVGPGSAYVAAAKRIVRDRVDVGLPAGPSESAILADQSADAFCVARDLLIEAEHGADSQAILVTTDRTLAEQTAREIEQLIGETPEPRRSFLESVFAGYGAIITAATVSDCADIVNAIAPEHLQIRTADPFETMGLIRNAAEILLGEHTPFSIANYAAGANAVLPTGGFARAWSGVSVRDFVKRSGLVHVSRGAYREIASHAATLADYEGFYWHARALRDREGFR